jgi:hypothetical protein
MEGRHEHERSVGLAVARAAHIVGGGPPGP